MKKILSKMKRRYRGKISSKMMIKTYKEKKQKVEKISAEGIL